VLHIGVGRQGCQGKRCPVGDAPGTQLQALDLVQARQQLPPLLFVAERWHRLHVQKVESDTAIRADGDQSELLPSVVDGGSSRCRPYLPPNGWYDPPMFELSRIFLDKAEENLAAAQSEFAGRRYNSCASRCYYACFQGAVYALMRAGIQSPSRTGEWGHDFVQAEFNGQLINRRKLYPSHLRDILQQTYALRIKADYELDHVTEVRVTRALRRTTEFVDAIRSGEDETR
jgi:uncharacterized protein (UPF0332 family)